MGLTVGRKTAKNLAIRRKNERIWTVSRNSKLIVEAGGYQQRAQISKRGSSRELYPIRRRP